MRSAGRHRLGHAPLLSSPRLWPQGLEVDGFADHPGPARAHLVEHEGRPVLGRSCPPHVELAFRLDLEDWSRGSRELRGGGPVTHQMPMNNTKPFAKILTYVLWAIFAWNLLTIVLEAGINTTIVAGLTGFFAWKRTMSARAAAPAAAPSDTPLYTVPSA